MAEPFLDYAAGTAVFIKVIHPQRGATKRRIKSGASLGHCLAAIGAALPVNFPGNYIFFHHFVRF
jgi:hypothetical protein